MKRNIRRHFELPVSVKSYDYISNVVIIKVKTAGNVSFPRKADQAITNEKLFHLKTATVQSVTPKFNENQRKSSSTYQSSDYSLQNIYELKFTGNSDILEVINELLKNDKIEYAEPSYISRTNYLPNDPLLNQNGQSYLTQVKAYEAWDVQRTAQGIVIAIVDSGTDLKHQDLSRNIFVNKADPINGLDDDHDGYVDNYFGWDFVGANANAQQEDNDPEVKSEAATHGVHVSGLASAVSNNGLGVASIAGDAKLLIVKTGADNDAITIYKGYEGIKYAVDHGAQIINCSWGNTIGGQFGQDIIDYAVSKGCLVIAAAGNSNSNMPEYPAAYKGVMAIGNVTSSDTKYPTSNYGYYISLSAPGSNILSTIKGDKYAELTGTSMSTPIVSSAAALIKAKYPLLTMQQVAERLRVTADELVNSNPDLIGQLGKGRLNVLRALIEKTPAIRSQAFTFSSKTRETFAAGDTVEIYFTLKNLLDDAEFADVRLSTKNPYVKMLNNSASIGTMNSLETKSMVGPFKFCVLPNVPNNNPANFQLTYNANNGQYNDYEFFTINLSLDYINIHVNQIQTSATSNGRVGYSNPSEATGQGLIYKKRNTLFEADLMMGISSSEISDNAYSINGANDDFKPKTLIKRINDSQADFESLSVFDDSGNPNPLMLDIKHRHIAYAKNPHDKYTIVEYIISNNSGRPFTKFYAGLYVDFDIDENGHDVTKFDASNKLAYSYSKVTDLPFAGVKFLSAEQTVNYYPLAFEVVNNPLQKGFSKADKYLTLSSGVKPEGIGETSISGYDVAFVTGYGPLNIPVGGTVKLAFAFIAGDSLDDLIQSAESAAKQYELVSNEGDNNLNEFKLSQNYPNPSTLSTTIEFNLTESAYVKMELYNISGVKVQTLISQVLPSGLHKVNVETTQLPPGVYVYRLVTNNKTYSRKMIIIH